MESQWVNRDGANKIIEVYANEQFTGQEKLNDEDAEVIAFSNPPTPTFTDAERVALAFTESDKDQIIKAIFIEFENRISVLESGIAKSETELLESKLPQG